MKEFFESNENKRYVFLAATNYHFLVSVILIKTYHLEKVSFIYAQNILKDMEDCCDRINAIGIKTIAHVRSRSKTGYYLSTLKDRLFLQKIKTNDEKKLCLINFRWNVDHIYYDASTIYNKCYESIFIEDGPSCYLNYSGNKQYTFIKKLLGINYNYYKEEKLKKIYVTETKRYPVRLAKKIEKFDIKELWKSLSEKDQEEIIKLFIDESLLKKIKEIPEAGIIYTQPLSEDGYISEEQKTDIYRKMYQYYSQYGSVILKKHPRDKTDYSKISGLVLESNWPSELLKLLGIHFIFAVGICTSAVLTTDADIKININENYLRDKKFYLVPLEI